MVGYIHWPDGDKLCPGAQVGLVYSYEGVEGLVDAVMHSLVIGDNFVPKGQVICGLGVLDDSISIQTPDGDRI